MAFIISLIFIATLFFPDRPFDETQKAKGCGIQKLHQQAIGGEDDEMLDHLSQIEEAKILLKKRKEVLSDLAKNPKSQNSSN